MSTDDLFFDNQRHGYEERNLSLRRSGIGSRVLRDVANNCHLPLTHHASQQALVNLQRGFRDVLQEPLAALSTSSCRISSTA
jgi:hypothetical protein